MPPSSKPKLSPQQRALLRCCASCRWIFKADPGEEYTPCPQCGFATYGARHVFGVKAYRYHWTQEPWLEQKLAYHAGVYGAEIAQHQRALETQGSIRGRRALALIFDDSWA